MGMGPNDVSIVRVYTRSPGGTIENRCFKLNDQFEVVVEAAAGTAILGGGGPYWIGVTIRNLTDSSIHTHNQEVNHDFGDAGEWDAQSHTEVFGPFKADWAPAGQQGAHMYEVIAYVRARPIDPDCSFAKSSMFLVYS